MGSTKVLLLIGLVLATIITMCGGNPHHDTYGFRAWSDGNFAHSYYADGATGVFLSVCISIRFAVFTIAGPDVIALSAGEIHNPRRTIPRVAKMIVTRIMGIYILGALCVGIICSSRNPRLLGAIESGASGAAASPWVLGLLDLDIKGFLPGLINFLIMLSGLSCGNAFMYSSSRTLYSLAQDHKAPRILLKCNKAGVPWVCVTTVAIIGLLAYLASSQGSAVVFGWFVDLTTTALVVNFTAMAWVSINWHRALKAQGIQRIGKNNIGGSSKFSFLRSSPKVDQSEITESTIVFPYIASGGRWTPYTCAILGTIISLGIGFDVFSPFSYRGFITSYFGVFWFCFMFAFWKLYHRTQLVDVSQVDIYLNGRKQLIDAECQEWEDESTERSSNAELRKHNFLTRTWKRFWGS